MRTCVLWEQPSLDPIYKSGSPNGVKLGEAYCLFSCMYLMDCTNRVGKLDRGKLDRGKLNGGKLNGGSFQVLSSLLNSTT